MSDESDTVLLQQALAAAARILASHDDPVVENDTPLPSEEELQAALAAAQKRLADATAHMSAVTSAVLFFRGLASARVDASGLSIRAKRALREHKITTPGQLAAMTENEVLTLKNFGRTTLEELRKWLADYGLTFRPEPTPLS